MMIEHTKINSQHLMEKVRKKEITFGGNIRLKIYGRLTCLSGKRMKKENRVFFTSEKEAINNGFRPCGNCMKQEYQKWIYSAIR